MRGWRLAARGGAAASREACALGANVAGAAAEWGGDPFRGRGLPLLRAKPYEAAAAISGDIRYHGEQKLINASKTYCERLIIRGITATKANFLETVCTEAR